MTALPEPDLRPDFYSSVRTKRLFAWLIDLFIVGGLSAVVVVLTAFIGAFFWPFIYLVIDFLYRTLTLSNGGGTWGMRLFSVEIVRADGRSLSSSDAVLHTLGYLVSMGLPVLQVISVVLMMGSSRKQGLSDHILDTVAVNRRLR
ncbi:RDD family protein [Pseudooceanicola sp. HF7]|uniref:RDD family protein n=1 Tax=Pseudooceanicola sp. HF7 TaxID=2721560 RepID=UPI00142F4DC5|nr:RDD family protein [Pseudooceanicola sp. HF7]NIZ08765.1 RDD family protein [Pseudooceanicola sp. HF7]